jgi:NADPH:quinone reductase-like Zn-dependent oxidoreductase
MRVWELTDGFGIDNLVESERSAPRPGPGQILVAMRAASINYRDLSTIKGMAPRPLPLIPFSDGAGDVVAVGEAVTRFGVGDRVCPLFYQSWISGPVTRDNRKRALGGSLPGVLQDLLLLDADGAAAIPPHLDFPEGATLPCAGLTAWRAVAVEAPVGPGDVLLVQGTGGVSMFAMQFAKARGAQVIITSSSDEKLARARELGADFTINYRTTPAWGDRARELTGGCGVDVVVEVGGEKTFAESMKAARVGGAIVVIGILGGVTVPLSLPALFSNNLRVIGISVGNREQFEDMSDHIDRWRLRPVIDQIFDISQIREALRFVDGGGHFGKVVLRF